MGTSLTQEALTAISQYETVYVALDPDAARKGLEMARIIGNHTEVKFRRISDDLKYFDEHSIKDILKL